MQIIIAIILIFIILVLISVIIIFLTLTVDTFLDLPYVSTKKEKITTIIKLASIESGDVVIDLGSGDGRLLFAAATMGAHAIGYEINPFLVALTRLKAFLYHLRGESSSHLGGVIVHRQDLWQADLKAADVIFVYGRKKTMQRFQDFVYKNAKRGAKIIVNTDKTIPFPTKKPIKSENGIYLYVK